METTPLHPPTQTELVTRLITTAVESISKDDSVHALDCLDAALELLNTKVAPADKNGPTEFTFPNK